MKMWSTDNNFHSASKRSGQCPSWIIMCFQLKKRLANHLLFFLVGVLKGCELPSWISCSYAWAICSGRQHTCRHVRAAPCVHGLGKTESARVHTHRHRDHHNSSLPGVNSIISAEITKYMTGSTRSSFLCHSDLAVACRVYRAFNQFTDRHGANQQFGFQQASARTASLEMQTGLLIYLGLRALDVECIIRTLFQWVIFGRDNVEQSRLIGNDGIKKTRVFEEFSSKCW